MERRGQLDAAGRACILIFLVSLLSPCLHAADESLAKLLEEKRWEEVVQAAGSLPRPSADSNYSLGLALARLGRWEEARAAFENGWRLQPEDPRFPVELGGVAFKQKRYAEAARWLRRGLRMNPKDSYAQDFLATIYFLQGNLDAALKYWNRAGKPQIEKVAIDSDFRVDPVLLDHALAFAPGEALSQADLRTSRARLEGLGIFPHFKLRLEAREDGRFDASLDAQEKNGWGSTKTEALLSTLRGVFYQTVFPEYFNIGGSAVNIESLVRWDVQKRRLSASLSGPLDQNPKYRYRVGVDLRDENWETSRTFQAFAPSLAALKLRRYAVSGDVTSFRNGGWNWSAGAEFSKRDYDNVTAAPNLPADALLRGYQLKVIARAGHDLLRVPERRLESVAHVQGETATVWSTPAHTFERLQASVDSRWMPRMPGDDYAMHHRLQAGKIFGQAPFDEWFILGLERDNDIYMRAHLGTRDGRKGSAPMGLTYFVSNWEIDKNVYNAGFFNVKLSPFLDTGKITDSALGLDSGKWLVDTGVQAKIRAFGVGFDFIYGKDLRSGTNTFYVIAGR